jgi:hypothetical protein
VRAAAHDLIASIAALDFIHSALACCDGTRSPETLPCLVPFACADNDGYLDIYTAGKRADDSTAIAPSELYVNAGASGSLAISETNAAHPSTATTFSQFAKSFSSLVATDDITGVDILHAAWCDYDADGR